MSVSMPEVRVIDRFERPARILDCASMGGPGGLCKAGWVWRGAEEIRRAGGPGRKLAARVDGPNVFTGC